MVVLVIMAILIHSKTKKVKSIFFSLQFMEFAGSVPSASAPTSVPAVIMVINTSKVINFCELRHHTKLGEPTH